MNVDSKTIVERDFIIDKKYGLKPLQVNVLVCTMFPHVPQMKVVLRYAIEEYRDSAVDHDCHMLVIRGRRSREK
jgi:hypothetical protein